MSRHKTVLASDLLIKALLVVSLVAFAVVSRVMPHPANFAPIAAIAIFGGAIFPKKWAVFLPLAAIITSDLIIGLHSLFLLTWGSFALIALGSNRWLKNLTVLRVGFASVSASVFFFVVSNFGVWLEGRLYPLTLNGLMNCYYNALPFFRNTLLGDLFYVVLLFGAYAFARKVVLRHKDQLAIAEPLP